LLHIPKNEISKLDLDYIESLKELASTIIQSLN
jgi:hypothetical protein